MNKEILNNILLCLYLFALPIILLLLLEILKTIFLKKEPIINLLKRLYFQREILFAILFSFTVLFLNIYFTNWTSNSFVIIFVYLVFYIIFSIAKFVKKSYINLKIKKLYYIYQDCEYINRILNIHINNYTYEDTYNNQDYITKLYKYPEHVIIFFLENLKSYSNNNNSTIMALIFLMVGSIMGNPINENLSEFVTDDFLVNLLLPILTIVMFSACFYIWVYFIMLIVDNEESDIDKKINLLTLHLNNIDNSKRKTID
ncbi:hypothetical protein SDC9_109126 [bioreactor metagenome]|uniref:Uncharacterized protein n=1 Tax=bioreactor metagenome TaxID=1076179 RepID=A0A645B9V3_9ZZZZ